MAAERPATEVYIGTVQGRWPLYIFESADLAVHWLTESNPQLSERRRLWRASISYLNEMELVPPTPATLRRKP